MSGDGAATVSLLPLAEPPSPASGRKEDSGFIGTIVEWSAAAAFALLAGLLIRRPDDVVLFATPALGALVVWIVVQDLASFTIADGAVVSFAMLGLAVRLAFGDPILTMVVDVLLTGGVLLAFREIYFRRRGFDGLGLGDVKLAAAGGLLVGALGFSWALLGASLAALGAFAVAYLVAHSRRRPIAPAGHKLAFGAFLAPALLVVWIVQAWQILWPILWSA